MFEPLAATLQQLRKQRPLVLNITNAVTMDFVANGLLSLGASPVMSLATNELDDLIKLASAVVINVGTLDDAFVDLAMHACHRANALMKPLVLDPVGAGATPYRTAVCQRLLSSFKIAVVRGNAGEIAALSDTQASCMKGVDSMMSSSGVALYATQLARTHATCVVMSGAVDVVTDGHVSYDVARGSAVMPNVTGTGCLLSAVVAAFIGVHDTVLEAAWFASYFYAVCGERAARKSMSPGSFKMFFLDELHALPKLTDYTSPCAEA